MVYNFFHSDAYQLSRKSDLMYVVPTPYSVSKTILRAPYPYRIAANSLVLSSNGLSAIALVPYFIKLPGSCLKSKAIPKTVPELYSVLFKASTAFSVFSWLVFYKINFENSGPSGPFIIHKNTFLRRKQNGTHQNQWIFL